MKPMARLFPPPNLHKDAGRELFPFCFSLSSLVLFSRLAQHSSSTSTRISDACSTYLLSHVSIAISTTLSDFGDQYWQGTSWTFRLLDAFSQSIEAWIYFPIERRAFPFSVPALDGSQRTLNMTTISSNASTCASTISAITDIDDEQASQSSIDGRSRIVDVQLLLRRQ